jgi:hypothetical protein
VKVNPFLFSFSFPIKVPFLFQYAACGGGKVGLFSQSGPSDRSALRWAAGLFGFRRILG